jgi:hypothetical protein
MKDLTLSTDNRQEAALIDPIVLRTLFFGVHAVQVLRATSATLIQGQECGTI